MINWGETVKKNVLKLRKLTDEAQRKRSLARLKRKTTQQHIVLKPLTGLRTHQKRSAMLTVDDEILVMRVL